MERGSGGGSILGASFEPLSSNDKRTFGVDSGVKIVEVGEGLFRDLGIRKGTVITTINNKKVNSADDVRSAAGSTEKSLRSIAGITPEGRQFQYQYGN